MPDYISTYTGIRFYPAQPDAEGLCIEDIAHALSLICRGNGHVSKYWSVAQHSIICAREAAARELPDRIVLACLLHDAGECYLSDVPRPFKSELPGYRELEDKLLRLIYTRFLGSPLTGEEEQVVREIDDGALYYDLKEMIHNEQTEAEPRFHVIPDYEFRPFHEVEKEFLDWFYYYYSKVCEDGRGNGAAQGVEAAPVTRAPERPVPDYDLLAAQLREFAATEPSLMPLLSNASALLKEAMADVNWAGFYLRREKAADTVTSATGGMQKEKELPAGEASEGMTEPELLLGPFQGKTACIRIPWGRGVCGTAAKEDRTQLVPDVHAFPGHIACDSASNAEIVVPIHNKGGEVVGVLDIDSPLKGRFTEIDREGLELFVKVLEECGMW